MPSRVFGPLSLALALSVTTPVVCPAQSAVAAPARVPSRLPAVSSWGYVLQGHDGRPLDVDALAASKAGLLVVEPSVGDRPMSAEEVARLRGAASRPVLAYLSIGEAESYRPYWRAEWTREAGRPTFLGPENPDWKGNFKVRYWQPEWQAIIHARLAELVATGFDGVYLDIIDAYEFWGPGGPKSERKSAADDMIAFVLALGDACEDPSDCAANAPICSTLGLCQNGDAGDDCAVDIECAGDAPRCGPDGCQAGVEGDLCFGPEDCAPMTPICTRAGLECQNGDEGDLCVDASDCGPTAPTCEAGQCL